MPADVSEEDEQDSAEEAASRLMLTAATDKFEFQMEWEPSSNRRSMEVAGADVDLPRFSVDLLERPSPWTQSHAPHSFPEITMTRHGPYMPGAYLEVNDEPWQVVVAHEIVDFATEKDLENFLKWKHKFFEDSFALDRAGNYVELIIAPRSGRDDVNYLNISVPHLFTNGEVPSEEKLNHALRGILETNYAPQFR